MPSAAYLRALRALIFCPTFLLSAGPLQAADSAAAPAGASILPRAEVKVLSASKEVEEAKNPKKEEGAASKDKKTSEEKNSKAGPDDSFIVDGDEVPYIEKSLANYFLFSLLASEIAVERGDAGSAIRTYLYVASQTRDPRLAKRAAELAIRFKDFDGYKEAADLWVELSPENPKALRTEISASGVTNALSGAQKYIAQYLKQSEDPGKDLMMLIGLLESYPNKAEAYKIFKTASKPFPNLYETHLGLAFFAKLNNDNKIAEEQARKAYALKKEEASAYLLATLIESKKPKEALVIYKALADKERLSKRATYSYGMLLGGEETGEGLVKVAKGLKNNPDLLSFLAAMIAATKARDAAEGLLLGNIAVLEKEEPASEALTRAKLCLANLYRETGRLEEAKKLYGEIVEYEPMPTRAKIRIAEILGMQGEDEKALADLDEVLKTMPPNQEAAALAALVKSRILLKSKKPDEALAALGQALQKDPNNKRLLFESAQVCLKKQDIAGAEKYFKKLIALYPKFAEAYNALGYALLEMPSRRKEASKYINQAYKLEPENAFILDSKGWLAFRQNNIPLALRYLKKATSRLNIPEAYIHLTQVYAHTGQIGKALETLKEAEKIWPDMPEIRKLIEALEEENAKKKP